MNTLPTLFFAFNKTLVKYLRKWDTIAAGRPDAYIAILQKYKKELPHIIKKNQKLFTLRLISVLLILIYQQTQKKQGRIIYLLFPVCTV